MTNNSDTQAGNSADTSRQQALQINVKMQQNQHTSQPIYANFTAVQGGQRVIIVDFGFVDPQLITTLNRMARSGEKTPDTIDATMSCRIALSIEAASQLAQQLSQLFHTKPEPKASAVQQNAISDSEAPLNTMTSDEKNISKEETQRGFKFPWSS
ncbi:hypothetical protein C8R34_10414 [Nitrosomonas sp. Nm84]|uniref:DUF3467 domain-containing protein n=1 Tax=Nitrosomonas sp. Nm84 TaxID=200124 RepID=UPI000D758656|nr:DUF3467 domain-containing protein [Nitrosomonas sp. Nm84]PXW89615.1 hypothetical protein C8R34_10414 [Nitrosomonas sp. Nm84]